MQFKFICYLFVCKKIMRNICVILNVVSLRIFMSCVQCMGDNATRQRNRKSENNFRNIENIRLGYEKIKNN